MCHTLLCVQYSIPFFDTFFNFFFFFFIFHQTFIFQHLFFNNLVFYFFFFFFYPLFSGVAQLHCPCGIVAVVRKEDVGNGIVSCMCGKCYCVKCGNFSHGRTPCPPPADTLKWLQKHAKPCPNCHNQIQKNGGTFWVLLVFIWAYFEKREDNFFFLLFFQSHLLSHASHFLLLHIYCETWSIIIFRSLSYQLYLLLSRMWSYDM